MKMLVKMIAWKARKGPKRAKGERGIEIISPFTDGNLVRIENSKNNADIIDMTIAKYPVKESWLIVEAP